MVTPVNASSSPLKLYLRPRLPDRCKPCLIYLLFVCPLPTPQGTPEHATEGEEQSFSAREEDW